MMNEKPGMDEEVLMEIIALAEKLMGDKVGSKKPSMISMEVSKAEPVDEEMLEEKAMEALVEEKAPKMDVEVEDDDEFELRKNKRIF
jgi:hypothetical protein